MILEDLEKIYKEIFDLAHLKTSETIGLPCELGKIYRRGMSVAYSCSADIIYSLLEKYKENQGSNLTIEDGE